MADLKYSVQVDTKQAENALNGLNAKLGSMRSALAGLAIGSFIANTYRGAEAVNDLSEQTGFAIQTILGLNRAFQENGSDANTAQEAISKFTTKVGEAADGNLKLQESFREVGISLEDLRSLSTEELFLKTIKGLGQVSDKAKQARLSTELLTKSAKANYAGIAQSVDGYISSSAEAAKANIAADKAAANFERAITNLKTELLVALKPLSELAAGINTSSEKIKEFVKVAGAVALVIGTFTALGKIISLVRSGFSLVAGAVTLLRKGLESLAKTKELIIYQFKKFREAGEFTKKTAEGIQKRFKFLGQGISLLVKGLSILSAAFASVFAYFMPDTVIAAFKKLGQTLGLVKDEATEMADYIDNLMATSTEAWMEQQQALEDEKQKQREVIDALQAKIIAIQQVGDAYKKQNEDIIATINNEAKYLKLSEQEAEVQRAVDDLYTRTTETIKGLLDQKAKLTDKQVQEKNAIDETVAKIKQQQSADEERIRAAIEGLQREREAIEDRNRAIEYGETIRQNQASLNRMKEEIKMLGMSDKEREQYQKGLEAENELKERLAQIDMEAARVGKNATEGQIADWEKRRQAALDYYNEILVLQKDELTTREDQARQIEVWGKNTKDALEESISASSNVRRFWDGLSEQIDNFVKTGKFNIKSFLASVVTEFIAAKLKLAALDFLGNIFGGGGGGLFGGKLIPGLLAEGGPAKANKPYIVGEQGPELFVPNTGGTVIPNKQLTGKGNSMGSGTGPITNNYITNNINAVDAKSVAQLFAENRKLLLGSVKMAEKELPYMA